MITYFYVGIFIASLICSAIYIYNWHKHFEVNISLIFAFVPIGCLGYVFYYCSKDLYEIIVAQKICYIGGSYLQLFILLSIINVCQIELAKWVRTSLFIICTLVYSACLTIGYLPAFYSEIHFEIVDKIPVLDRDYGWMHTIYFAVVIVFFLLGFIAIAYSWLKKRQVPRTIIIFLTIPYVIVLANYFVGKRILNHIETVPLGYLLAQIMYLIISKRMNLYNVADTVVDSMVKEQSIAYISFDFGYKYLGSNDMAKQLMPDLESLAVDQVLGYGKTERRIRHFLDEFIDNNENNVFTYSIRGENDDPDDQKIFKVNINYLYEGNHKRGYIVTFTDDTANRKYIQLLDTYNENLQSEVEQKTKYIYDMHDNLIMSLAMMVESRDNSTGGHIKRTSECVRILVDEMKKSGSFDISDEFCKDVIKAAPMHDLGKIAVDDAVLRKPGRFTDEEYEEMKKHAAEGARVIHQILLQTDDESFKTIAENVAHYHHERFDGSGYPEGISGEDIPFEARIMAIADVYDALVSKRVYKEAFDFKKADAIIIEGMGTQFDPGLKEIYEKARPRLEDYYIKVNNNG